MCVKKEIKGRNDEKRKNKERAWLDMCIKKYNNKFNYSLVKYITDKENVKIICPIHGIFEQSPLHHYEIGCANCNYEKRRMDGHNNFIKKSKIIHNNKYDYSLVKYKNNKIKVKIICPIHGIFEQKPESHYYHGCHFCNESKGEKQIQILLDSKNIKYKREHKFNDCKYKRRLPFDFYLPEYNLCIEYDGSQHFSKWDRFESDDNEFEIRKIRDQIKNEYCLKNNIKLIRIKYNENIDKKLIPILKSLLHQ
jgi:very-short-patch-repair endonuclease